jgi:hypothetical protein
MAGRSSLAYSVSYKHKVKHRSVGHFYVFIWDLEMLVEESYPTPASLCGRSAWVSIPAASLVKDWSIERRHKSPSLVTGFQPNPA